ncbi:MAG TPA: hypothetical protein VF953_06700 [Terriglobales bacterium]
MSTIPTTQLDLTTSPIIKVIQRRSLIIGAAASVIALFLAFRNPTVFFRGYLLSYMDWLGVCLGSMAIVMVRHMTGGGWGTVIRRILGASMRTLPLLILLFIPLLFAVPRLYPWAMPLDSIKDPAIREHLEKHSYILRDYLNYRGFVIRAVIYFAIWFVLQYLLSKFSFEHDTPPFADTSARFKIVSAPGIILYTLTISFAAIDWVMSLNPSWVSTIYGLLFVAGELVSALCFAIVIERILFNYRPMSVLLRPNFVHDHGNFLLAFVMVWAYFSFSQWLIIWAGNLPEEITWYFRRLHGGWEFVGLFLIVFHFFVPFFLLLSRSFKRDITRLVWLASWMLVARYIDLFWHIEPSFSETFTVTLADLVIPFAMGGLWIAYFCHNLSSRPLVPAYDATAQDVLEPAHE